MDSKISNHTEQISLEERVTLKLEKTRQFAAVMGFTHYLKEVMFLLVLICLLVSNITQKVKNGLQ